MTANTKPRRSPRTHKNKRLNSLICQLDERMESASPKKKKVIKRIVRSLAADSPKTWNIAESKLPLSQCSAETTDEEYSGAIDAAVRFTGDDDGE